MRVLAVALAALLAVACGRLDSPERLGELVVAVQADPASFVPTDGEAPASGIEHDLAQLFAAELGVKARFVLARDANELADLVRSRQVHYAAAATIQSDAPGLRYSSPLRETEQLLAQHGDALAVDDVESLAGRSVEVLPAAPQAIRLRRMAVEPPPRLEEKPGLNEIDLLERVATRRSELAAVDGVHFDIAAHFHPDLAVAQELPGNVAYAWAFRLNDTRLAERADAFIARQRANGTLAQLEDRYFGHIKRIDADGSAAFIEAMRTRLPHFRAFFHEAQRLTGIDWRLLAALAYQESKWDPLATSRTGVRGMMMLTEDTADRLRVANRLDARQSVVAGARYLADLRDDLPADLKEPDRTWMALAAYNLGMGHFNGARHFAIGMKLDTTSWYEMKKVLPLLARPEYYRRLKSGRARGGEAVIMVENVRTFQGILNRFEAPYGSPVKPAERGAPARPAKAAAPRGR